LEALLSVVLIVVQASVTALMEAGSRTGQVVAETKIA